MAKSNSHKHAITVKSSAGILRVISTVIGITAPDQHHPMVKVNAIWDTGASSSVITRDVANQLGISPTGKAKVNTASQKDFITDSYIVDIYLKADVRIRSVKVTTGVLNGPYECLIGMDIIALGDFSITNRNGQTCMTFGVPSVHLHDYVADFNRNKKKMLKPGAPGSNITPPKKRRKRR